MSPNSKPTVLIVGAGTFGTSTAYHLSHQYKDPSRITIIDRWDPKAPLQDKQAAAIDTNRIIRTDYESSMYCDLANEAIHPWFWNIAVQGHFHKTGWVVLDKKGGDFGEKVRKTFVERGGDYTRDVDREELEKSEVLKGLCGGAEMGRGYFNPEAGWCDAERATMSFLKVALNNGVQRVTGEVSELLLSKSGVSGVRTKDGKTYTADKIVLAAGAWTSSLLSPIEDALDIPPKDSIETQITAVGRLSAYYTLSESETQNIIDSKMPIVVIGGLVDIIPPSQPNRTVKINDLRTEVVHTVTTKSGRRITAPTQNHQSAVPEKLRAESAQVMQKAMPHFTSTHTPSRWRICFDAVTPTEDWLLTAHPHPSLSNLTIATGGSFHSYKFLPVAGKYVAKVLRGESCGAEKDEAWKWKSGEELGMGGGLEFGRSGRGDAGGRREILGTDGVGDGVADLLLDGAGLLLGDISRLEGDHAAGVELEDGTTIGVEETAGVDTGDDAKLKQPRSDVMKLSERVTVLPAGSALW
ncbi:DAO-domain-containing protein [Ophiobolus disseminans]|uniref:DAO-domain-containing protein n=1 Tax=Ophiobolus disseminans TaxID=1469910 RepID=A0A6A7AC51_9PLEO|nr:DAO-domain-containing protein [Ophiobolus disseminans]